MAAYSIEARKVTMKEEVMIHLRKPIIAGLALVLAGLLGFGAVSTSAANQDPCDSLVPATIGGPMLSAKSDTMVFRWLANANYEIAYRGKVYLFDTYYDRKARTTPLGFTAAQVKTANIIFLGHGHFDHISDIVPVAKQTNAPVVGAPITIETAVKMGLPPQQATTVRGGETLHYDGLTVDIGLAHHAVVEPGLTAELASIYKLDARPNTPEEAATTAAVMARGTNSPDVADKGTLAFGLTFENGFKVVVLDSAGPITDGDRQLAQKLGPVDVAIIGYQAHAVAERQVGETFPLVQLFHPRLYLPSHHDGSFGTWLDIGVEPLFETIRDDQPDTNFLSPLYRSPICVATSGAKRGSVIKFRN